MSNNDFKGSLSIQKYNIYKIYTYNNFLCDLNASNVHIYK